MQMNACMHDPDHRTSDAKVSEQHASATEFKIDKLLRVESAVVDKKLNATVCPHFGRASNLFRGCEDMRFLHPELDAQVVPVGR